jgi:hypothetical protein
MDTARQDHPPETGQTPQPLSSSMIDPITPAPSADPVPVPDPAPAAAPAAPDPAAPPAPPEPLSLEARLQALAAREAELDARERRFKAREHVMALGLDPAILAHIDYSSDEALQNSLQVAALASRAPQAAAPAPVPQAVQPPAPQFATYLERSRLFREDPVAYQRMIEQESAALKAQQ